MSYVERY